MKDEEESVAHVSSFILPPSSFGSLPVPSAPMAKSKKSTESENGIALSEYVARRDAVLKALKGAVAVVFAGEGAAPLLGRWRPDFHFLYLTGLSAEPGGAILFDPTHENPDRRCVLVLRPLNPEVDRWDGYRETIGSTLRGRTGFTSVMRSGSLPALLTQAARRSKRLACLHPFSTYPAPVSPDLAVFKQIAERVPGVAIEDRTDLLPSMRAVKSPAELALMRGAIHATAAGFEAAFRMIRPGVNEGQIAQALEGAFRAAGGDGVAYNSIVGSGLNGTVLHYMDNKATAEAGDLLVIDAGANCQGYAADVTRTLPVSGRFTSEQREPYEVVLQAQAAAIKAAVSGAKFSDVDAAARAVIDKAGYGDAFIHGTGHPLGIEVHDVTPDGPLREGMVITVEPGVYFPERKMGIRIEDDVLITKTGPKNLTAQIAKTIPEVEAAMGQRR
jgi:Xaa-Pro aminopeptidase